MKQPLIFFDLGGVLLLEADRSVKKLTKHAHVNLFLRTFEFASLLLGPDAKNRWFLGELASSDIIQAINENIDKPQYISFFEDADERDLIKYGCRSFLLPELLAENTHIIPEGLEFVKKCDGSIVQTSRTEKPELFSAVIGGYGVCGIIVDVTLQLEDNYKIKEVITPVATKDFLSFYNNAIANNPDIAFFNGFMYPPYFDTVMNFCWHKTDEPLTIDSLERAHQTSFVKDCTYKNMEFSAVHFPSTQKLRQNHDLKHALQPTVVWRSYEMSHAVEDLASHWSYASKILQEYFVPIEHFDAFVRDMTHIIQTNNVKMLNISIRYVPQNTENFLTYAHTDCFAFVCYIFLFRTEYDIAKTQEWTQQLIDAALKYNGTYYLPYHRFARPDQMLKGYPRCNEFFNVKSCYDPYNKFQNNLLSDFKEALHI